MRKASTFAFYAASIVTVGLIGCSNQSPQDPAFEQSQQLPAYNQANFTQYISETQQWLSKHRIFMTADHDSELDLISPKEYRPKVANGQGVLLVHGLGDTPYSYIDIAHHLADQGYLVRTILLPGHASKVGDLQLASYENWRGVVEHHIDLLKQDTDSIWVGGYSTGANLVTEQAIEDEDINGVLLFSPAFQPNSSAVKYAGLASYFVTWADQDPEDNPLRYNSLPMNAAAAYYESSVKVRQAIEEKYYTKPVFMLLSEGDKVINTQFAIDLFSERFTNPNSRLVWQGEHELSDKRAVNYSMTLPEQRISNGSHMGLLFSPENPNYGIGGTNQICSNGQSLEQENACLQGEEVWFSAWGYTEPDKIHARLTYNPYFDETMQAIDSVMSAY